MLYFEGKKNGKNPTTAQLPTLAVFLPWGSSEGADQESLPDAKLINDRYFL